MRIRELIRSSVALLGLLPAVLSSAADQSGVTLTWALGQGTGDAAAGVSSAENVFSVATMDYGKMTVSRVGTAGVAQTLYCPSNNNGAVNDDDALTFAVKPKKGITLTPKSLSFDASRWGTNGGKFDVVATVGDASTTLAEGVTPERNNDYSHCEYDLSSLAPTASGLTVMVKVYGLASAKEYGFANVVLTFDVSGEAQAVASYSLDLKIADDKAGTVASNPTGSQFDEGVSLTLTATENFGYHFAAWVDAEGNAVSTSNPYTFEIAANTSLTATYTSKPVYALNLGLTGGANANLVSWQPAGNIVDGVHHFEEGTEVKLTAIDNRIMTFTGWEDGTTTAERVVSMDADKNMTANFAPADYIVGWDLYLDQPAQNRAADYKADTENAGMLSLRKADGTTTSWLARGIEKGQENGKYAARIWKNLSEEWYFEMSFSTKGYSSIKLSAAVGDDYNTYSVINAQYSTDGENFTTFGTFNPPARGWDGPNEFALPEAANDQTRVYVRFMPDRTSDKVGVESDYDGLSVAELFVLGELSDAVDVVPTLVGSNPEAGSKGASASGSIILTYDSKVVLGTGNATLGETVLTPTVNGKTVIFKYSGLKYSTDYKFSMPEGYLTSKGGKPVAATEIAFTTMERVQPTPKLYDAIVAADGSGDYTTLQAAIDAAPEGRGTPWLIFVKNGQYNEHIDIPATKPYLHIIGQDRDKTVVLDNKLCGGDNALHVSVGATVVVKAHDVFFENITLENSYGHELQAGPQALALNTSADRIALNNVALLSYQDTWITSSTSSHRHYIKNSLIEGAVDFIYNSGDVYLDGDTLLINRPSGGYIVAPSHAADVKWGYVFQNNVIRPYPGMNVTDVWLGRPWHNTPKTVFINTQTFVNIPAKGWYETMGGLPTLWADYNTIDADGNPVDLSQRQDTYYYIENKGTDSERRIEGKAKNYLTAEEAAEYTLSNVMGGSDGWQPDLLCEECEAPKPVMAGTKLTWDAVPYAICYVVSQGDKVVSIQTETEVETASLGEGALSVQAVNENGGLSLKGLTTADETSALPAQTSAGAVRTDYYTLGGVRTTGSAGGLLIEVVSHVDGSVSSRLVK